jgi:hypothetical protein
MGFTGLLKDKERGGIAVFQRKKIARLDCFNIISIDPHCHGSLDGID